MAERPGISGSIAEAIGNTPLVALDRITRDLDGRIVMKLEYLNPGFSKKDRAALGILRAAEESGELKPGQTVLELTSGNMGTGLALVCAVRGYPFVAVMSKGNTPERARMMRALGAEVVLVDQCEGSREGQVTGADLELVESEATRLATSRGAFRADQFALQGNRDAHYAGTAAEIWSQSGGKIDAFCDFAGSGGTFAGCAAYFREQNPAILCFVVEPEGAEALAGGDIGKREHVMQGGGYLKSELRQLDGIVPDGFVAVSDAEAIACTRRLAKEEGIFAGFSSGANLAAAMKLLEGEQRGSTLAIIACDSGLKYLSTPLWP